MEKVSFYSVIILNLIINIYYIVLTVKKKIRPSLAMWLFFLLAVVGSLFSYMLEGDFSPLDNILNTSDVLLCLSITITIAIFGDKFSKFNKTDIICLTFVAVILVFWHFSKAHFATHLSLQVIQAMAYIPVFQRMLKSEKNNESFLVWGIVLFISVLSLFTAKGILAYIYIIRAIVCVFILLLFMTYLELKNRPTQKVTTKEKEVV